VDERGFSRLDALATASTRQFQSIHACPTLRSGDWLAISATGVLRHWRAQTCGNSPALLPEGSRPKWSPPPQDRERAWTIPVSQPNNWA